MTDTVPDSGHGLGGYLTAGVGLLQGRDLGLAGALGRGDTRVSLVAALKLLWRRPVSWWSRIWSSCVTLTILTFSLGLIV